MCNGLSVREDVWTRHGYEYTDYDNFSDIDEWDHNETIDYENS